MSDLISRQDAIDAIAKRIYHIEDGNENDALRKVICDIDALPSVNAIPYDSTVTLNSPTIIKATSTDLIIRQDAMEILDDFETDIENGYFDTCTYEKHREMILQLPSADRPTVDKEYLIDLIQEAVYDGEACAKLMDMVDRPTGEWVEQESDNIEKIYLCSNCENYEAWGETEKTPYCPNCGAKMFKGGEEE